MSDIERQVPHRIFFTSDCPRNDTDHLQVLLHDARNKLVVIMVNLSSYEDERQPDALKPVHDAYTELQDQVTKLSASVREGEINEVECAKEIVKFRSKISSIVRFVSGVEVHEKDMVDARRDLIQATAEFERLINEAEAYLTSTEINETSEEIDISAFLLPIVTGFQKRFSGVVFDIDVQPGTKVSIYPVVLKRALENLLLNSAQAMKDGKGVIHVRIREKLIQDANGVDLPGIKSGKYCLIEIEDNGSGIPPEVLGCISEKSVTTKMGGSGIGLVSVRNSVQSHKGHLMIESAEGQYTRVTAFIPSTIPPASGTLVKGEGVVVAEEEKEEETREVG